MSKKMELLEMLQSCQHNLDENLSKAHPDLPEHPMFKIVSFQLQMAIEMLEEDDDE